jgi:Ca2+-binding EF-hand superfamily protein
VVEFDKDGSGSIDHTEFKLLCRDLGYRLNETEFSMAVKVLDADGNGSISYDEFLSWWQSNDRFQQLKLDDARLEKLQKYLGVFNKFDKDGSGSLDRDEIRGFHAEMVKQKLTKKSVDQFVQDVDKNGDGNVSFNEVVEWIARNEL